MRIKILKSLAGLNFSYSAGQEVEIEKEQASQLIKAGLAEEVQEDGNAKGNRSNRARTSKP